MTPETPYLSEGGLAWVGLVLYIVCYDCWAASQGRETLSTAFYRALRHPVRRWPVIVAWSYITGHLFKLIPEYADPLRFPWEDIYRRVRRA